MPADDFASLAARADLARLLAACYYQPGPEFAEERLFDSLHAAAAAIDDDLAARANALGEAYAAADAQELLIDYTRLFLGPTNTVAQPYGSVWLEQRQTLMQDSTAAVLALYAEGGFAISDDFLDLPDHIAAELEFLYLMLFRQAEALRQGDEAARARHARLQQRLLAEHLGRWVPPFAAAIRAGAQTAFYRALAELTAEFVARQQAQVAAASPPDQAGARPA